MARHPYQILDVFTDTVLEGNPLAIVYECDDLDAGRMQRIAAEFNLSETVFAMRPKNPAHLAAIRIFTPNFEMPFAGHPTVGSAVALARRGGRQGTSVLVLEEKIGDVRCAVKLGGDADFAEFDLPELSAPLALTAAAEMTAEALGLLPADLGFENHVVSAWSAGVPYVCVPVSSAAALAKASLDPRRWREIAPDRGNGVPASAYVYVRTDGDAAFRARMFTGGAKSYEDPATGSALAAFSGAIVAFDEPVDGPWTGVIEQGFEMGRPSRLRLEMEIAGGRTRAARIGGNVVLAAEGTLFA